MTGTVTSWGDHVAHIRETFIDGLVRRGMRLISEDSNGEESNATLTNGDVTVTLGSGFPYLPPSVTTITDVPRTWHQDRNGGLCLYTSRDRDQQPWLDPGAFLERIELWFEKNSLGWPGDPPALDLEAYLDLPWDSRFIVYDELRGLTGKFIKLKREGNLLRAFGDGKTPPGRTRRLTGYVVNLGVLTVPPTDWNCLIRQVDESGRVKESIKRGLIDVLLIRYARSTHEGVLAVIFSRGAKGRQPHLVRSAAADRFTMGLRAGHSAGVLGGMHVYVVGGGALGSYICDGLSRSGIGHLTVQDSDYLTPGNMTRHVISDIAMAGLPKALALQNVLTRRPYNRAEITSINEALVSPSKAVRIFEGYDLVVDATADGAVTAMLEDAARIAGHRFITACLQNDGRTLRVDIVPTLNGEQPIPAAAVLPQSGPDVFEGGCGEPVSPTPPYAIAEAAAMAVRHIIGYLVGNPPSSAGEIRTCQ